MQTVYFHLSLTAEQIRSYYEGVARQVVVRASDGRRVQFPAQWLRRFVTLEGVHGLFEMRFGDDHKLIDFRRVGD
ncbi:MAG: DUF2835 domain-containing protein [Gammaproteobacteria bacterium]|nr:DUF2835 domain-containing protein [Gammaproteobacteria bacterium]HRX70910.1 DUF2835 family protein [Candidatus Competibacteraceae bacterium]